MLEQIIPGVDTARFLSGDINYIRSTVFSLIDSLKFEKKRILKDLLELSHTHGLSQAEVDQSDLSIGSACILLSY